MKLTGLVTALVLTAIGASSSSAAVAQAVALSPSATQASAERVTISFNDTPLAEAIWTVSRRSGVPITFNGTLPAKRVTYRADGVSLETALSAILKGTGLKAKKLRDELVIVESGKAESNRTQGIVTGKVIDAKTGKGIAGANVTVGKDTHGARTGEDGGYQVTNVEAGAHTISVRMVGYAKQTRSITIGVGATVTADFRLEPSANVLDQVVVTGTVVATELKAVPSAITVVTAKQIQERGITRIEQLFRGEVPGLVALNGAGPGNNTSEGSLNEVIMFSRGATRISSGSHPSLITNPIKTYVDGVELADPKYLSQIDPQSVERIEILPGPQASTIYGANAINGVMQIFTKRGNSPKPQIMLTISEGLLENSFSSALSPLHRYDGTASGMEGRLSYNIGGGWDYTGAWMPAAQLQRTNVYGGGRYQARALSFDISALRGWTQNNQRGSNSQIGSELSEQGLWGGLSLSLVTPVKRSVRTLTLAATVDYLPVSWWSHRLTLGSDASNVESIGLQPAFISPADTTFANSQNPNSRTSQAYASTLRVPLGSQVQASLTYGADHWRVRTSTIQWNTVPSTSAVSSPSITRVAPAKNSGVYVQSQIGIADNLFFTYGIRTDWNPNYGENATVRPGRYGVSYAKELGTISMKLRGSYGRSIRPPEPSQKLARTAAADFHGQETIDFYTAPGSTLYSVLANPEIGPEFQQGGEGGVELYLGNRGSLVLTRYNQTVDGLVTSIPGADSVRALVPGRPASSPFVFNCSMTSVAPANSPRSDGYCYFRQSQSINAASVRNQGWEAQGRVNVGPISTLGTYSWAKSRVIGVTQAYRALLTDLSYAPGQTFNLVPEHTWALNVAYASGGTSVLLNFNGFGESLRRIHASDLGTRLLGNLRMLESYWRALTPTTLRVPTKGYTTANLNTSHRFSPRFDATMQVTNLTNYYQGDFTNTFPSIGRQMSIGARIRLQ